MYLVQLGFEWVDDCCEASYTCKLVDGEAQIIEKGLHCHENANCGMKEGKKGCFCKEGYQGDGVTMCQGM